MDDYLVTLAFGALAVATTMLVMARLIPDEYDRGLPSRVFARARSRHQGRRD
jgi:hypothetical protein